MYDSVPFEQEYSEKKAKTIAAQLETALWQGDTASGNVNLNKFDGLVKLIGAATGVVCLHFRVVLRLHPVPALARG